MDDFFMPQGLLDGYECPECLRFGCGGSVGDALDDKPCSWLLDFFVSFREGDDSVSAVREKFLLHIRDVQSGKDYGEYVARSKELAAFVASHDLNCLEDDEKKTYHRLEAQVMVSRLWWQGLSEAVVKGWGKVADRERRSADADKAVLGSGKVSIQQFNVLIGQSAEQLEQLQKQEKDVKE